MRCEWTYPPEEDQASIARADVGRRLSEARLGQDLLRDAEMVTDELVANAITHAGTEFRVALAVDDELVRIAVSDWDDRLPVMQVPTPEATSGRGLLIVATLALSWGFEATARDRTTGKTVWAVLAISPPGDRPL
jgi:anti-sigma regulatory factor (Ser/Thr protein kinase)